MTISYRIPMPHRGVASALTGAMVWLNSAPLTQTVTMSSGDHSTARYWPVPAPPGPSRRHPI